MNRSKRLNRITRGAVSAFLALAMLCSISIAGKSASAATTLAATPYARINYTYTDKASCGTIRYISQVASDDKYFYSEYWGSWESAAKHECGTSCISMALSYLGISITPQTILDKYNGATVFGYSWGGASYLTPKTFSSAFSNYTGGEGKYSPVIIRLKKYSSSGTHFLLVVGQKANGKYILVDPWSSTAVKFTATIQDEVITYKGNISETLTDIRQYYYDSAKLVIPKTALTQVSAKKSAKVKLSWKQKSIGSGYQIQYASSSTFKDASKVTVKDNAKIAKTIKNLSAGESYYFRVRVYKDTTAYGRIYSKWCSPEDVTAIE